MSKNYQRDSDDDKPVNTQADTKVRNLVDQLIKKGLNSAQVMQDLKIAFADDNKMQKAVYDAFEKRLKYITKRAKAFKSKIYDKLPNISADKRFIKAKKYAKKNGLSDDEMNLFTNLVFNDRSAATAYLNAPVTPIHKLMGNSMNVQVQQELDVTIEEMTHVRDIIAMKGASAALHSQVSLQALTYRDCDIKALQGNTS